MPQLCRWEIMSVLKSLIFISSLFQAFAQASSIQFTNDIPPDVRKVQPGQDVSLGWSFSYSDSVNNPSGPWKAQGVEEISFGIWKPIDGKNFFVKKLVVVDSNGQFEARDGYNNKMNWSWSTNKLTFTIKGFEVQDQATYGINVELGLTQKPLKDTVLVYTGASYTGQDGNSTMRNETAYISESIDLLFKRSPNDTKDYFSKYRISKGNDTYYIISLSKPKPPEQLNGKYHCLNSGPVLEQCKKRYSLRYVNSTHVSFSISNLTLQDSGRYFFQTYFFQVMNDPKYTDINLIVQERPSTRTAVKSDTPTQAKETPAPKAKSGHSDDKFSVILLSLLMIVQAMFH